MGHEITPDRDHPLLEIGRTVHEIFYEGMLKEVKLEGAKIDLLKRKERVVCEIKTSSKFIEAARFQLLYYLYRLKRYGIEASGNILIPRERKRIRVTLNKEDEEALLDALKGIQEILEAEIPPRPIKIPYCRKCAYREFCWA